MEHRIFEINGKLPTENDIEYGHKLLDDSSLLRLIMFSDLIQRYAHLRLKGKTSWIETLALIWLTVNKGRMTHTELARLLVRSNYKVTRIVDSLENKDLAVREHSRTDRRVTNIWITDTGLKTVLALINDKYSTEEKLVGVIDDNKLKMFTQIINKLRDILVEPVK
jgi:DNA-binding MarR family transcriptional regulator